MNELTQTSQTKSLANVQAMSEGPLASDLIIPYLLLSQGSSDAVKERKAQIGDFILSTTKEQFGNPDKPCELIFLGKPQTFWRVDQQVPNSDKWRFLKTVKRNATNEIMEFKYWGDANGEPCDQSTPGALLHRRFKQFRVFAILPSMIGAEKVEREKALKGELPDISKALTPVIVSLQSTSGYPCGKEIETFNTKAMSFGVPIWRYIASVSCVLEKNDEGTFYCWKLSGTNPPKPVPKDDLAVVQKWAEIVTSRAETLKVDESAENQVGDTTGAQRVTKEAAAEVC